MLFGVLWFGGCVRRRPDTRRLVGCRSHIEGHCVVCSHCGNHLAVEKVEPLYSLREAERLIPLYYPTLVSFLRYHKDEYPALYQDTVLIEAKNKRTHRRTRLLTATEIKKIRKLRLHGPGIDRVT